PWSVLTRIRVNLCKKCSDLHRDSPDRGSLLRPRCTGRCAYDRPCCIPWPSQAPLNHSDWMQPVLTRLKIGTLADQWLQTSYSLKTASWGTRSCWSRWVTLRCSPTTPQMVTIAMTA